MSIAPSTSPPVAVPAEPPEGGRVLTAGDLVAHARHIAPHTRCRDVAALFGAEPELFSIVVLDEHGVAMGMLRRLEVLECFSTPYFVEINGNKPCTLLMDRHPIGFDAGTSVSDMADAVAGIHEAHLLDGFLVTRQGRYAGTGRVSDLLRAVNSLQVAVARNANPLTMLPGNTMIHVQMELALKRERPFVAAYFDLNHFKPFNDVYGYSMGDRVIMLCAQAIQSHLHPEHDFLGHLGGDDFIAILGSSDWEARVAAILPAFEADIREVFLPEHVAAGGYRAPNRLGVPEFHPLVGLAVGVVTVAIGQFRQPIEISAAASSAKKVAKQMPGSAYFVERRQQGGHTPAPPAAPNTADAPTASE